MRQSPSMISWIDNPRGSKNMLALLLLRLPTLAQLISLWVKKFMGQRFRYQVIFDSMQKRIFAPGLGPLLPRHIEPWVKLLKQLPILLLLLLFIHFVYKNHHILLAKINLTIQSPPSPSSYKDNNIMKGAFIYRNIYKICGMVLKWHENI